jgi:hypothetical protein
MPQGQLSVRQARANGAEVPSFADLWRGGEPTPSARHCPLLDSGVLHGTHTVCGGEALGALGPGA